MTVPDRALRMVLPAQHLKSNVVSSEQNATVPLSDDEIRELELFLISDATPDESMMLDLVDGFLTAIVIGPRAIPARRWLPLVWGPSEDMIPEWESQEQAQRIIGMLVRHMNVIAAGFRAGVPPPLFMPTKSAKNGQSYVDGEGWSIGFIQGLQLCMEDWKSFLENSTARKALRPMFLLAGFDMVKKDGKKLSTPKQREELAKQIPEAVREIYRFWLPHRQAASDAPEEVNVQQLAAKTAMDEMCPCGSGMRFRKCCGDRGVVLH